MNKKKKVSFGLRAKIKLANMMKVDLASVETDKGELFFVEGDTLEVGTEVFIHDADGADVMPEDGEYKFGDEVAVVKNGVVEEIKSQEDLEVDPEIPTALDTLGEVVQEIVEEAVAEIKEEVTSEIEVIKEELKKTRAELNAAKKVLERAKLANAKDFANPNPRAGGDAPMSKGKAELKKFGL